MSIRDTFLYVKRLLKPKTRSLPFHINIEIMNHCNLKCFMCPRTLSMTRTLHHMTIEEFNHLMSRIPVDETGFFRKKPSKIQRTCLHMFGESLLNKDFKDIIDKASEKFNIVGMSTNGTLLTTEISKNILHSKLDVLIISLDSVIPEIYRNVRCSGPPLSRVLEGIKNFLILKNRMNHALRCDIQVIDFSKYPGNSVDVPLLQTEMF